MARGLQQSLSEDMLELYEVDVFAKESAGSCVLCQGKMRVQKSFRHKGRTIRQGTFQVCETIMECAAGCRYPSGVKVTRRATSVADIIPPRRSLGYDVIVFVGLQRFLHHRQRQEIRALLQQQGIPISTGEVSELSKQFVHYLGRLHRSRREQLKTALESDGGWPLHVDATGEAGRGTLLMVMAGWRQWVLGAWKISTERADLILPCLRVTVRRFGVPCAAMRDMGRAITPALNELVFELNLNIPVLACHQHFLADIGKDLLESSHAALRTLFRRAKVRPNLRGLVRDLGHELGGDIQEGREAVRQWQSMVDAGHRLEPGLAGLAIVRAMAQWTLDFKAADPGLDFPFVRPYLTLYDRCMVTLRATDAFLRTPPEAEDKKVISALQRLRRYLAPVDCQVPFQQLTKSMRRIGDLFDELRKVLRLASDPPKEEKEQDLEQMRAQFDQFVASLPKRRPERGPAQDIRNAIDIILKHIDDHGQNLWGHAIRLPESAGGGVRLVFRTNYLAENFFGGIKHIERRRSGRKNLTQDLEHLPAEALLAHNLKHPDYVAIICGSLDRLGDAFAELDKEEREMSLYGLRAAEQEENLQNVLQLASASLSTADRRVIRTDEMNQRMVAAAKSRESRCRG